MFILVEQSDWRVIRSATIPKAMAFLSKIKFFIITSFFTVFNFFDQINFIKFKKRVKLNFLWAREVKKG